MAARLAAALLAGALMAAPLAAQKRNGPPVSPKPLPVDPRQINPFTKKLYSEQCGDKAVHPAIEGFPADMRLAFRTEAGAPAALVICVDEVEIALLSPINTLDSALVFMSYQPFAPFWPAAEARWGNDLGLLREELRNVPAEDLLAGYPYGDLMMRRSALVLAGSTRARAVGDYDRARSMVQGELDLIAAENAARAAKGKGPGDNGFETALLIIRLGNITADRDGPAAGAELIADLVQRYPVPAEYRANTDMNYAAMLAEAGRTKEALAVVRPMAAGFNVNPKDPDRYVIAGSMREVGWIMACALTREEGAEAAAPYAAMVKAYGQQPVDEYLNWTKATVTIELRLDKCLGDPQRAVAAVQANKPSALSPVWLEFQEQGARAIVGHKPLPGLVAAAQAAGLLADYRQLPESYWPALKGWLPPRGNE